MTAVTRLRLLRGYLVTLGVFGLFWWPLSHWFYPDWYHDLLGFSGTPDDALVKVIGTIGVLPVLVLFLLARRPRRDLLGAMLAFQVLMGATYVHLIGNGLFPTGEYLNVALLTASTLVLATLYPWRHPDPWRCSDS